MSNKSLSELWKNDLWWTSQYNFEPAVRDRLSFPPSIELHDVTLRDGEQTPGVVFTKEEKVAIAVELDKARVHRIEAGMPLVSDEDRLAIKEIVKRVNFSRIFAFCRTRREDVDSALSCDVQAVVIELPALRERLKVMGITISDAAEKSRDVVEYAKAHGLFVVFFPYDTTRADFESVTTLMKAGEEVHADRLAVVDTVGASAPEGYSNLIRNVQKITRVPLEVHCHNSLGLATANTLAGLQAGAVAAHASVNGIGELAGNTAIEEVAGALLMLYGVDTGVDIPALYRASRLVEKCSGIAMPVNKPVFGRNMFRRESGIVVERYYKMPEVAKELELLNPGWLGKETEIVLGKKSGKFSILLALKHKGMEATDDQVKEILDTVKEQSIKKKDVLTDDEFEKIIDSTLLIQARRQTA